MRAASIAVPLLAALLITLIPTTIAALLSAIGIAGMDRLVRFNVLAKSGRAVEAAGDIDVLLLDKTGTMTIGDRHATEFRPLPGVSEGELAEAAYLASLADETPEGRSIVALAREKYGVAEPAHAGGRRGDPLHRADPPVGHQVRRHADPEGRGRFDPARRSRRGRHGATELRRITDEIARAGGTPLAVARDGRLLGVLHLKDILKAGMRERFAELRRMGIRTVMITGDNPLTAASIAAEAGVDDFLAEATPEDKLALIRKEQTGGRLVAMCGDGTNDAPALAQADVGVAMNTGTQAAREAGNMVDLDSDPTKLIEVVGPRQAAADDPRRAHHLLGRQRRRQIFRDHPGDLRRALSERSACSTSWGSASPQSAILSAIIFNALIIPLLVPLALKGVRYRPAPAGEILRRNLVIYGLGGLVAPFIGIKLIDLAVNGLGLA